jgi:hypothetical protein
MQQCGYSFSKLVSMAAVHDTVVYIHLLYILALSELSLDTHFRFFEMDVLILSRQHYRMCDAHALCSYKAANDSHEM